MQPDVDWANGMDGGRVRGRSAVREYWARQWETLDPNVEPVDFTPENDGRICVTVHSVVRDSEGDVIFDGAVEHLYTFENGLVRRMEIRELPKK